MDDAALVRGLERLGDLAGDRDRLVERDRPAREARRQVLALDQLHDEHVERAGGALHVGDRGPGPGARGGGGRIRAGGGAVDYCLSPVDLLEVLEAVEVGDVAGG